LDSVGFGAVVFPLGENPLPPTINDGDLDGDLYVCIWDEEIMDSININDNDEDLINILPDDVVNTGFEYELDGTLYDALVVQKVQENPDLYRVDTGPKMQTSRNMTREQIYDGKDLIVKVIRHRFKGGTSRQSKGKAVEFECEWASGESLWNSTEDIRRQHAGPPELLLAYVQKKGLLRNNALPKKFCKWIKDNLGDADVLEITNHRTDAAGKVEVFCRYSDEDEVWQSLEDAKEDCKLFLGAYAEAKNLFGEPGWGKADGYWLDEVHDVMCTQKRSKDLSNVITKIYRLWEHHFDDDEYGPNHPDTRSFARAYTESIDIEKHGGVVKLPLHLQRTLPPTLRKRIDIL